jgi:hypothetical protein
LPTTSWVAAAAAEEAEAAAAVVAAGVVAGAEAVPLGAAAVAPAAAVARRWAQESARAGVGHLRALGPDLAPAAVPMLEVAVA